MPGTSRRTAPSASPTTRLIAARRPGARRDRCRRPATSSRTSSPAAIACIIHTIVGLDEAGRPVTPVLSWADTHERSRGRGAAPARSTRRPCTRPPAPRSTRATGRHGSSVSATSSRGSGAGPGSPSWWPSASRAGRRSAARWRRGPGCWTARAAPGPTACWRSSGSTPGSSRRSWTTTSRSAGSPPPHRDAGRGSRTIGWFAAWGDGGCGNVGLAATGRGTAALMVGTSGALRAVVDGRRHRPSRRACSPIGSAPATVVGGQLSEGGGTLTWVSTLLGRSRARARASGRRPRRRRPRPHRPAVHLRRARPRLSRRRQRLARRAQPRHRCRGDLPGDARVDRLRVRRRRRGAVRVLHGPPSIVASGGALTHSPLLGQVLADSLGRDISVAPPSSPPDAARRCWPSAARATLPDVADACPPPTRTIHADPGRSDRYRDARQRRDALYHAVLG